VAIRRSLNIILIYVLMVAALVTFTYPFIMLFINSFKDNGEILIDPFSMPKSVDLDQFVEAFKKMDFLVTFKNSFIITTSSVILIILFSAMCAHYIVRNRSRFNNGFFSVIVASMIIPFQVLMIPLIYIYGKVFNLIDTVPFPLLITFYVGFGSALAVFIYHGFIKGIPLELEEAAFIDGCNKRQVFFRIVFPILIPTSVTIAILNVLWIWNDYLLPSLVLYEAKEVTMPIKMKLFNGQYMNNWELLIPAIFLTVLPILIAYLFGQKYIIRGVIQGAIK
jgi:raffinose/stachyose/melibiose transport system permease protein